MQKIPDSTQQLLEQYSAEIRRLYGCHLTRIILYGSYARGDFRPDSDIDILILLNLDDIRLKDFNDALSDLTYDFNMDHNIDIMPYAKSEAHFQKWSGTYPFYMNIEKEGVVLYAA